MPSRSRAVPAAWPQPRSGRLFRRRKLPLGQRNAALLRHNPHRLGKADVFNLAHKAEHVARSLAAEAVVELPHRVHAERRRFFLVERAQPRVVLRPRLAQPDVALDHLDDVGLLLHGLGKVAQKKGDGFAVTGDLTIHGVTKPVVLNVEEVSEPAKDPWGNTRIGLTATAKINRKDFGLTWNSTLEAGGVLVGEDVAITLDVEFIKAA
jgi:hypothetical protein